ncbi:MAG TPA: CHC2 zinc finger domain-containing protein [Terriglobales bacterium]|nr:CHC2 zinc finger domain-containing protein [Terriglobales bacterium]
MPSALDFKDQLKQQADIVRIIGEYVKLRKSGAQNFQGLCPFHKEKTPSFSVHATRGYYHCFGCGESGDVYKFLQKIEGISFGEAVRELAQKLGVPMPKMQFDSPAEQREAALRMKLLDIHERACSWFQEQLRKPEAAHAREYLAGRGLNAEMIAKFRIGYAPESGFLLRDRLRGEFDDELLKASGLFSWKEAGEAGAEHSRSGGRATVQVPPTAKEGLNVPPTYYSKFRDRIMFPICNEAGRVIAFTGRTLAADEKSGPKYLNSPETSIYSKSRVLFNLNHAKEPIRKLEYAILVEGQMDCISVYAAGFHNVIASSGTAFTDAQARLVGRFSHRIVVNFDPDTAGAAAAERSLALLVEEDFEIKVLTLESGFDPDLFIRKKGANAYAAALKAAPRYFDYLIDRARSKFPVRTPEGKVKALNYLLPHIQRVPSRIARMELAGEISQKIGIDSAVLAQELKSAATSRTSHSVKQLTSVQVTDSERILVRALATQSELHGGHTSTREGADEEFDPALQARFVLEQEPLHQGLTAESLLSAMLAAPDTDPTSLDLSEADRRLLSQCLLHEDEELTPELLEGAILSLRRRSLERRQRQIRAEILEAERRNDSATLSHLLREKIEVDRALNQSHPS